MSTLIIAEYQNHSLDESTLKTISAAQKFNQKNDLLIAGHQVNSIAKQASQIDGIHQVLVCDHPILDHQLAEPMRELILSISAPYNTIMMSASTTGKNIMPGIAAKLDVMQLSDIMEIKAPDCFIRPIYAGNAMMTVKSKDSKKVITIRTTAFNAISEKGNASIKQVEFPEIKQEYASSFVCEKLSKSDRPSLTEAKIIVSGGRALGSKEQFKLIEDLADQLNAAIGASRAAVDAGYAPNDWQVGQTGKVVAPELYIAIGISGAIQHVAGMKDSKYIVAINKDEEAPIFQIADYGIIGDLFVILPELKKKLEILGYSG